MSKLIDHLDRTEVPLKSFLSLLSMRNPTHNVHALQGICDDEQQVEFVERLAGTYTRVPPAKSVDEAAADLELLSRYDAVRRASRHGNTQDVYSAQQALQKAAQRANVKGDDAIRTKAERVREELRRALLWTAAHGHGPGAKRAAEQLAALPPLPDPDDVPVQEQQPEPVEQAPAPAPVPPKLTKAERVAAGLCAKCGKVPPVQGKTQCDPCRLRHLETMRRYNARKAAGVIR